MKNLGTTKELFVLPFDHRGSFLAKLFGIEKREPTPEETKTVCSYKEIIYDGFKKSIAAGVPKDKAGILVDEQFGEKILLDARKGGYLTACPAEKSGQDEFDFQFGEEFGAHIAKLNPSFVKVLVRYNVESSDKAMNDRQAKRLRRLSDYCHANGQLYMFELLVPATPDQLKKAGGKTSAFDAEQRPELMIRAIRELQGAGVEPDVWKIEGLETKQQCDAVAKATREGDHRKNVGCILLGRGENEEKVKHWLGVAASVPGFIGFAVGRTVFWDAMVGVRDGKMTRDEASTKIGKIYHSFCDLWMSAKKKG